MNRVHKSQNFVKFICIGIFYLLAFFALENRNVPIHIIHCEIDNWIPFCEYFIVPYLLWFFYVLGTGVYFLFFNDSEDEYKRLERTIIIGMVVFLLVSYFYPNGQLLRPVIEKDTIFNKLVAFIYRSDTATNILPSLHVFYSVTCVVAFENNERVRKNKVYMNLIRVLTVSIVLSTMFLKQHSVIDVVMALIMNGICYQLFYNTDLKRSSVKERRKKRKVEGIRL